jgi:DNA-directed RNA polymerase subunit RPC12/RpoP
MKRSKSFWCVECDEIFEIEGTFKKAVESPIVCPSCTNRRNIMPVSYYIGSGHAISKPSRGKKKI